MVAVGVLNSVAIIVMSFHYNEYLFQPIFPENRFIILRVTSDALSRPTSCALVQTAYFQAALCAGYAVGAHDAHCPPLLYDCRDRVMGDPPFFKVQQPFGASV